MANKYGPWATLIDVGGNPQLSAFWKRRLKMLVPASRTSLVLSRRNLSQLAAAGILACLLPTVFFTTAAAQEKKPADKQSQENGAMITEKKPADAASFRVGAGGTWIRRFRGLARRPLLLLEPAKEEGSKSVCVCSTLVGIRLHQIVPIVVGDWAWKARRMRMSIFRKRR